MSTLTVTTEPLIDGIPDWWAIAHCNSGDGENTGLFFSEDLGDIATAKRICERCPVLADCLEGAMARREPRGVWGGQLFLNGKIIANKRRRGRPRKHPRPEDQLPRSRYRSTCGPPHDARVAQPLLSASTIPPKGAKPPRSFGGIGVGSLDSDVPI